jgi:hypothetical protein
LRASKDEGPGWWPSSFETRARARSSSDNGFAVARG